MRRFIRSLVFNIVFYIYTALCCFGLIIVFPLPRKTAFQLVRKVYFKGIAWVERLFLGLDFRVTGLENLPAQGSYILALKHYSTYETLKLPVIFGDIAIILKRELSWIPFWGWYTIKLGMIPIDRGGGHKTMASLIEGAKKVIADNRPILIFPQGTRVGVNQTTAERPYKFGIVKIAEALQLPIVPVALNSGAFWPKHSFRKKSGTVDFKILPPLPADLSGVDLLRRLEDVLEPESNHLIKTAAIDENPKSVWRFWPRGTRLLVFIGIVLFCLWSALWFGAAHALESRLAHQTQLISPFEPQIDGFPGRMNVLWPQVSITDETGRIDIDVLEAKLWPVPGSSAELNAPTGLTITGQRDGHPLHFRADTVFTRVRLPLTFSPGRIISLKKVDVASGDIILHGEGDVNFPLDRSVIQGRMKTSLSGYKDLLDMLTNNNLIKKDQARLANAFFDAMAFANGKTGAIDVPLSIKDDVLYAGMIRLFDLNYAASAN